MALGICSDVSTGRQAECQGGGILVVATQYSAARTTQVHSEARPIVRSLKLRPDGDSAEWQSDLLPSKPH
jgi:hypothetical protein